jgi:hypothetical protein
MCIFQCIFLLFIFKFIILSVAFFFLYLFTVHVIQMKIRFLSFFLFSRGCVDRNWRITCEEALSPIICSVRGWRITCEEALSAIVSSVASCASHSRIKKPNYWLLTDCRRYLLEIWSVEDIFQCKKKYEDDRFVGTFHRWLQSVYSSKLPHFFFFLQGSPKGSKGRLWVARVSCG